MSTSTGRLLCFGRETSIALRAALARRRWSAATKLLVVASVTSVGTGTVISPLWSQDAGPTQPAEQREIRPLQPIFQDDILELAAVSSSDQPIPPSDSETTQWTLPAQEWESMPTVAEPVVYGCARCPGVCRCPGHPPKPRRKMPGDVDRGDCPPHRYQVDQRLRSGDPDSVYKWAQPTYSQKYTAWYVGGGGGFIKGRSRTSQEGTWGLDYGGLFGHAKVWLNYTCNRYQGGEGAYETEHQSLRSKFGQHE